MFKNWTNKPLLEQQIILNYDKIDNDMKYLFVTS